MAAGLPLHSCVVFCSLLLRAEQYSMILILIRIFLNMYFRLFADFRLLTMMGEA